MSLLQKFMPPLLAKAVVTGLLVIVLLVPIGRLESLVRERVQMRDSAAQRVAESWGGAQTTGGVLLVIPVETTRRILEQVAGRESERLETLRHRVYVLPDTLRVAASADPSIRTVGLYDTPVYTARLRLTGEFVSRDFAELFEARPHRVVRWDQARVLVLNSESRALRAADDFVVAGESVRVAADAYAGLAGLSAPVPAEALVAGGSLPFRASLTLTGSGSLTFLPLARKADIALESAWPHPKFEGAPAPIEPRIDARGFRASWSVLEINRNFGQVWTDETVGAGIPAGEAFARSGVGVSFHEPVDVYQKNYRAVHYAVLLIAITFLTFFLWERLSGLRIHVMQYLMVGLALALFYLLLLALSEHVSFDLAYAISAGALVALVTVYLTGVLGRWRLALGAGAGLATLYGLLYWILRSEDYSLLMGALLLFGVLTGLMTATRRVDWSESRGVVPGCDSRDSC